MTRDRNGKLVDLWSLMHFASGIISVAFLPAWIAFILLAAWEPLENFIISPIAWRYFKINFGHESLQNAISDIVFDALGISFGLLLINFL